MEFVNLVIPANMLNPVLDFLASINTENKSITPHTSSAIEVQTIKFSAGDIQTTTKYCDGYSDEQNLIEQLKSLGIKYSEVKKYCQQYPDNIAIALERAGKPGTKRPVAMFISTLKNPGEIKSIVKGDRLAVNNSPTAISSIQPNQQQSQLLQIKQLLSENHELIKYKAQEWKFSKAFAHKDIEFIEADVISCYVNDPIRFELDRVAFKAIQERKQREAERDAEEKERLARLDEELKNISHEQRMENLNKLRLALKKSLINSEKFTKKEEVLF